MNQTDDPENILEDVVAIYKKNVRLFKDEYQEVLFKDLRRMIGSSTRIHTNAHQVWTALNKDQPATEITLALVLYYGVSASFCFDDRNILLSKLSMTHLIGYLYHSWADKQEPTYIDTRHIIELRTFSYGSPSQRAPLGKTILKLLLKPTVPTDPTVELVNRNITL